MSQIHTSLVHATAVTYEGCGVLILGPPGSGKSSLALMVCDAGGDLIGDDQAQLSSQGGILMASPAPSLAGLLEVRGIGIINMPHVSCHPLHVALSLQPWQTIPRLPDNDHSTFEGITLPHYFLDPTQPSCLARLRVITRLTAGLLRGTEA
ncbi:MAG: HPr kinase/phosphorylase [Holosporales bacterium]